MKTTMEFYCSGGCKGYWIVRLRTDVDGNYIIVCPGCGHEHFRKIMGGVITGDRHSGSVQITDRIVGTKSAFSKTPVLEGEPDWEGTAKLIPKDQRPSLWSRFLGRRQ